MSDSDRNETPNRAMKTVSHTHPDTGRPFGDQVVFARGPVVAADGGEPEPETEADAENDVSMKDIDHEPPHDADANPVFERGREGRDGDR